MYRHISFSSKFTLRVLADLIQFPHLVCWVLSKGVCSRLIMSPQLAINSQQSSITLVVYGLGYMPWNHLRPYASSKLHKFQDEKFQILSKGQCSLFDYMSLYHVVSKDLSSTTPNSASCTCFIIHFKGSVQYFIRLLASTL